MTEQQIKDDFLAMCARCGVGFDRAQRFDGFRFFNDRGDCVEVSVMEIVSTERADFEIRLGHWAAWGEW